MMLDTSLVPPELYSKIMSVAITLIGVGVTYIARQAHLISKQVGRVYRTLFGEDEKSGLHNKVTRHARRLDSHHTRLTRVETMLNIEERREGEGEEDDV